MYLRSSTQFSSLIATIQIPSFPITVALETPAAARQSFKKIPKKTRHLELWKFQQWEYCLHTAYSLGFDRTFVLLKYSD